MEKEIGGGRRILLLKQKNNPFQGFRRELVDRGTNKREVLRLKII